VNYPALRWAAEDCQLDGAAKPILLIIAYHADRDTGLCWVGQRRLAKEAGVSSKTVERWMVRLEDLGVLEVTERGRGPKPNCYRIAEGLVEGQAFGSGLVEGSATASNVIEGDMEAGEVIHNPAASADTMSAQGNRGGALVPTSGRASADIGAAEGALVPTLGNESADSHVPSTSGNAGKGLKQGSLRSREVHVLDDASSAADAAGVVEAREPPPAVIANLERLGLRSKPRSPAKLEQQPRSREEQLAYLERLAAEEKAKSGQEGTGSS
jgi:hypothetical protein